MPQFMYRIRPRRSAMLSDGPTPHEERVIGEHFAYLQALCGANIVLFVGRTTQADDTTFGIVVLEVADAELANKVMEADPAVREDVMWAELFPFRIALVAEALAASS